MCERRPRWQRQNSSPFFGARFLGASRLCVGPLPFRKPGAMQFQTKQSYGANKPDKSKMTWVDSVTYNRTDPFVVGTNAILEVRAPSPAFKVDTRGWACPCGQRLKYPRIPFGITVAFKTERLGDRRTPQSSLLCSHRSGQ